MDNGYFKIIELQQGTAKWLEWRHGGIGASDAPAIMGENPYKTYNQLLVEKCGPARDSKKNKAMLLGTRLEPEARSRYIQSKGISVSPVCVQSTSLDWLRASLDGFALESNTAVEIKCGQSVYRRSSQSGTVPEYYYGQLQHILAVTNLNELDFFCYWPGLPELLFTVERNDKYIKRLLLKEQDFWERVVKNYQ